ncbi:plasminogen activator inhibitor 1 RNA-binding protein-like [Anopheles moucheti]|uniref:plasminogen activator inhibitor 1 RNA-binding protein-like n=1 Tax=Anopheles moucheti TaxID=186751 RepID=UPI0022F08686|nr:plasminogen activator inhibitor 1 RNA-binding protein-like [Anopheles moucheti]
MENTSYGINVANRYDLFCIDDDAGDPIEAILKSKQKQQKKQQQQPQQQQQSGGGATTAAAAAAAPAAQSQQAKSNAKSGEKENKAGGRGAENRHPDKSAADAKHAQTNGTGNHLHNQRSGGGERRGIKETQKDNIRNQENQRGTNPAAKFPRGPNKNGGPVGGGGGNEDKYPRKPRDFDGDGQRKPYAQNGGGGGVKRFDGRGKRELDRQSGSNKTGIKAVDKRDGAGSHNWGSSKQDAKEYSNNPEQDYQPQDADTSAEANAERTNVSNGAEETNADGTGAPKSDDEAKEMTLDEWKAQKAAVRLKPQYNLRKAGEGEDSSQWDKMVALDRKSNAKVEKGAGADGGEEDDGNDTHSKPITSGGGGGGGGKNKQFLEIEYHFNDSRRGGLGRSRGGRGGRGGGGGRGMGREGGPGGRREYGGGDNYRGGADAGEGGGGRYNHYGGGGDGADGGDRPQRDYNRRNNRPPMGGGGGPDRNYEGGMNNKYSRPNPRSAKQHVPAAPKVDDEHDFPSLG